MIVWLNGPFGVGKTTVAAALHAALPEAVICDPEVIGWLLRRVVRVPTGDYQDLRSWRWLVVTAVALLDTSRRGPVLVPMTLLRQDATAEVLGALRARGRDVRHVLLDVSGGELRRRIAAAPVPGPREHGTRAWRSAHVDDYERARTRLLGGADVVVDTTYRRSDEVAAMLLGRMTSHDPPRGKAGGRCVTSLDSLRVSCESRRMATMLIFGLVLGVIVGFILGRMWAERSRAAFEARTAWNGRKRYRGTRPF